MVARPWALTVIAAPTGMARAHVRALRVRASVEADMRGYALLDMIEITGHPQTDDETYQHLEHLAWTYTMQAFLINGSVDRPRLDRIAEAARVLIVDLHSA